MQRKLAVLLLFALATFVHAQDKAAEPTIVVRVQSLDVMLKNLNLVVKLVGQEAAGAERAAGAAAGEGRQAVGEVGRPPAADGLVADTQDVREFQLGVAQLDAPQGAQAQHLEGLIGQLAGVG